MKDLAAARKLARVFEGTLEGDAEIARAADELAALAAVLQADREIPAALANPAIGPDKKARLLEEIARLTGLSAKTASFLKVLVEHRQAGLVPLVAAAFGRIRDARLGFVSAEVTTAQPLAAAEAEATKRTLETRTGRKVRLTLKTDPAILGGMIARVGSTVYDGSIRSRLAGLRSQLSGR